MFKNALLLVATVCTANGCTGFITAFVGTTFLSGAWALGAMDSSQSDFRKALQAGNIVAGTAVAVLGLTFGGWAIVAPQVLGVIASSCLVQMSTGEKE